MLIFLKLIYRTNAISIKILTTFFDKNQQVNSNIYVKMQTTQKDQSNF